MVCFEWAAFLEQSSLLDSFLVAHPSKPDSELGSSDCFVCDSEVDFDRGSFDFDRGSFDFGHGENCSDDVGLRW